MACPCATEIIFSDSISASSECVNPFRSFRPQGGPNETEGIPLASSSIKKKGGDGEGGADEPFLRAIRFKLRDFLDFFLNRSKNFFGKNLGGRKGALLYRLS